MPRTKGDRPKVVPDGCVNFAFIGQFADTVRDTVFTTEYSVRTAMEAVYTLLNVDRGVPEVFGLLLRRPGALGLHLQDDGRQKLTDLKLPFMAELLEKKVLKRISGTVIEELMQR